MKLKRFDEGLKEAGHKIKRITTGKSAGEEIDKLPKQQQEKIVELYQQDPMEAAKYLRSIIIKEKNSQFGLGLALTIAGAAMIYKAYGLTDKHQNEGDWETVKDNDGITQFLKKHGYDLKPGSKIEDFRDAVSDFGKGSYDNGIDNLTKGLSGPDKEEMFNALKAIKGSDYDGQTLSQVFKGKLSGTGKSIGDLLDWGKGSKVWVEK